MIVELGLFALIVALLLSLAQAWFGLVGAARGSQRWMAATRPAVAGQWVFVLMAFVVLSWAFYKNDFSVLYVAQNSNSALPTFYRFAAVWGAHEGSLLLWALALSTWSIAVSVGSRSLPPSFAARVLGVLGIVSAGFLAFVLFTSNPFERLLPAAVDGADLNPLLQDFALAVHPPMLYIGYVGFSVAFAFAVASLLEGRLDERWARWVRPWTTLSWMFLTVGIALGSWWAYYELGWGGWWFWDPVENASFMPWLVGTALIHSLAVTEKRGLFKSWTLLLAIIAFSLSLLGTFLVRSGILISVHAFASDPSRGLFILAFLGICVGGSLFLYAWRAPLMRSAGGFAPVSRESFLLVNNVLLLVTTGLILLGTLYPLFVDALGLGKISVGPPYFDAVFVPIMAPLVFLMGIGPIARWKKAELPDLAQRLKWALGVSLATALIVPLIAGRWTPMIAFGLFLAFWVIASAAVNVKERVRHIKGGLWERLRVQGRSYWGMHLAHLGVAVFIIGVTLVKGYEVERDVRMDIGDSVTVNDYAFKFEGTKEIRGPNYTGARGSVEVTKNGRYIEHLYPEKRIYNVQQMPMTEAAIDSSPLGDLYVSLGEPVANGAWSVRVYHKPFITWIWGGCVLMALGGLVAISDRRYRLLARRSQGIEAAAAKA